MTYKSDSESILREHREMNPDGEVCWGTSGDVHRYHDPDQGYKRFLCCGKCGHMEPWSMGTGDVMSVHNVAGDGCHHFDDKETRK